MTEDTPPDPKVEEIRQRQRVTQAGRAKPWIGLVIVAALLAALFIFGGT